MTNGDDFDSWRMAVDVGSGFCRTATSFPTAASIDFAGLDASTSDDLLTIPTAAIGIMAVRITRPTGVRRLPIPGIAARTANFIHQLEQRCPLSAEIERRTPMALAQILKKI
jgi:hypothetical protein